MRDADLAAIERSIRAARTATNEHDAITHVELAAARLRVVLSETEGRDAALSEALADSVVIARGRAVAAVKLIEGGRGR